VIGSLAITKRALPARSRRAAVDAPQGPAYIYTINGFVDFPQHIASPAPAWVSTGCATRWGTGSRRDNATLFDFRNGNELTPAADFLEAIRGL
jgi:hypothetical protein